MKAGIRLRALPSFGIAIVLALAGQTAQAAVAPPDAKALLRQADNQFLRGDLKSACKGYLQVSELTQGTSASGWLGLSRCYARLRQTDKAVEMARKARAAATSPGERTETLENLGELLLGLPEGRVEAARLYREEVDGSPGARSRVGLLAALIALQHEAEAADLVRSLRAGGMKEGELHSHLCEAGDLLRRTGESRIDLLNDRLRAIDPDTPLLPGGKVAPPGEGQGYYPDISNLGVDIDHPSEPVIFSCVLDVKGRLQDCLTVQDPSPGLTSRSLQSVMTWILKPATLNGAPVPACYRATISINPQ